MMSKVKENGGQIREFGTGKARKRKGKFTRGPSNPENKVTGLVYKGMLKHFDMDLFGSAGGCRRAVASPFTNWTVKPVQWSVYIVLSC